MWNINGSQNDENRKSACVGIWGDGGELTSSP